MSKVTNALTRTVDAAAAPRCAGSCPRTRKTRRLVLFFVFFFCIFPFFTAVNSQFGRFLDHLLREKRAKRAFFSLFTSDASNLFDFTETNFARTWLKIRESAFLKI